MKYVVWVVASYVVYRVTSFKMRHRTSRVLNGVVCLELIGCICWISGKLT